MILNNTLTSIIVMTLARTSTFSPLVRVNLATDHNSDAPAHVSIHDTSAFKSALMEMPWLCRNGYGSTPLRHRHGRGILDVFCENRQYLATEFLRK